MRSSTGRYFVTSASNQNLSNFFKPQKHPTSSVHEIPDFSVNKNTALLRYLGYGTIALGITVITVNIVFLPYLFATLDGMELNVRSNGDVFKAKSNTLWSQMQSLKRTIYRRSIGSNSDSLSILELLPKGFIPFPFQKFRLKTFPPSITPYNFKEMLTKEITKLFDEILNNNTHASSTMGKKFNDPYSSSSSSGAVKDDTSYSYETMKEPGDFSSITKEPNGAQIISSDDDDGYGSAVKNLLSNLNKGNESEMMKKITEMEILESMKNAFILAEQEERERQGENIEAVNASDNGGYGENSNHNMIDSLKMTTNEPMNQSENTTANSENSYMKNIASSNSNANVNQSIDTPTLDKINDFESNHVKQNISFVTEYNKTAEEPVNYQNSNQHATSYQEPVYVHTETSSTTSLPDNQETATTSNQFAVKNSIESSTSPVNTQNPCNSFITENIIYIETLEDEQKCIGDPGAAGNDGYDGVDGLPGLDGIPGNDGEKMVFGDICNC